MTTTPNVVVHGWSESGPTYDLETRNAGWRNRRNRYSVVNRGYEPEARRETPDHHEVEYEDPRDGSRSIIGVLFNEGWAYDAHVVVDGTDEVAVSVDAREGYHFMPLAPGIDLLSVTIDEAWSNVGTGDVPAGVDIVPAGDEDGDEDSRPVWQAPDDVADLLSRPGDEVIAPGDSVWVSPTFAERYQVEGGERPYRELLLELHDLGALEEARTDDGSPATELQAATGDLDAEVNAVRSSNAAELTGDESIEPLPSHEHTADAPDPGSYSPDDDGAAAYHAAVVEHEQSGSDPEDAPAVEREGDGTDEEE